MADSKKKDPTITSGVPAISDASDGGQSRLTKGYKDNPDKPDDSSIAQVEELVDGE